MRGERRRIITLTDAADNFLDPTSRHMLFGSYLSEYSLNSALAISTPTRTGCSVARLVTIMNTPWHSSFAYLLDVGVNEIG